MWDYIKTVDQFIKVLLLQRNNYAPFTSTTKTGFPLEIDSMHIPFSNTNGGV